MHEVKSGEYRIVNGTGPEDCYLYTKNLGNDVACIILMNEETAAIARQVSEEDFAKLWQELLELPKRFANKKPKFRVILVGGNDYGEPNSASDQYVTKLLSYMGYKLLHFTEETQLPDDDSDYIFEHNELRIKFQTLGMGKTEHPESIFVNAIVGGRPLQDYDQWERERYFGCYSENDKRKSIERYVEKEWERHVRFLKSMKEHKQKILAWLRQKPEQAEQNIAATETTSGEKRLSTTHEETPSSALPINESNPSSFMPVLTISKTPGQKDDDLKHKDKKPRIDEDSRHTTSISITTKS